MSTVKIEGNAGGSGTFTIASPNSNNTRTLTLPDEAGTILASGGALGTPSSGTVTNLTGTASININGTVGATTASTGAFTTVTTTGNVGIGTTSTLNYGAGGTFKNLSIDGGTGADNRAEISLAGGGGGANFNLGRINFGLSSNTTNAAAGINGFSSAAGASTGGILVFGTSSDVSLASYTERLRITSAGDVGIGTSSPASKLDVVGTASFSGTVGVGGFAALSEVGLNVRFIGNLTSTDIVGVGSSISAPASASGSTINFYSSLRATATSGSRGFLYNFYAESPTMGATSTANTIHGLFVQNLGNAAITNAVGVRIEAQSGSTSSNLGLHNLGTSRLDGNVGLATVPAASGTGITFPATQSASSDANTLDDYEEGTWTPAIAGVSTYTIQLGTYTKVGKYVFLIGEIAASDPGTLASFDINGFPFVVQSSTSIYPIGNMFPISGFTSNATSTLLQGSPGQAQGRAYWVSSGATNYNNIDSSDLGATFTLEFSISFIAVN